MNRQTEGFALITALTLVVVLGITLATYSLITVNNARTSASSAASSAGFYAAEAALNARAERVRQKFKGFEVPEGTPPSANKPCQGGNLGSGDLACENATVGGRALTSYVKQDASQVIKIPVGENFENLTAEETPFTVSGQAVGRSGNPEAIATLVFRSRLVPLFQFAVFFDKDLEFTNTATLNLSGPVHTNGNMFLDSGNSPTQLTITGQTTASYNIYRGWKHQNVCQGNVRIADASNELQSVNCSGSSRTLKPNTSLTAFGGKVKANIGKLEVPTIDELQPNADAEYWQKADVRVVMKRNGGLTGTNWQAIFVRADGQRINVASGCEGKEVSGGGSDNDDEDHDDDEGGSSGSGSNSALSISTSFRDNREAQYWSAQSSATDRARTNRRMLDVNVRELLSCIQRSAGSLGVGLADSTDGGLVIFLTVDDKAASTVSGGLLGGVPGNGDNGAIAQTSPPRANNYGVRLRNGALLRSSNNSHPTPKGITFVSDQAAFIEGDFNARTDRADGWLPASVLSDSINVLSSNWDNATPCQLKEGNNAYYMSKRRWRKINGTDYDVTDLPAFTNSGSATYSGTPLEIRGETWYRYTTANRGHPSPSGDEKSQMPLFCRNAAPTTVKTAILAGTATTGDELQTYNDLATQSGGVHNMMRFHEEWGANNNNPSGTITYTYRGSLVSLDQPQHAVGAFKLGEYLYYNPPQRNWSFEEEFRESKNLPPLTPRFVYLKQDNFTRSFEQP